MTGTARLGDWQMEQFLVGWDAVAEGDLDGVVDHLGRVMEELLACDELIDPTLEHDAATGVVAFELIVTGEDALDAMQKASGLVRSCLHAAGVGTPGWPSARDIERSGLNVRFEQNPSIEQLAEA